MTTVLADARDDDGFEFPSWSKHVALDAYLNECPAGATTLGTFFTQVVDHVRRETGAVPDELFDGLPTRRWFAFRAYRLRDFMRLAHSAARIVYWNQSLSDGLRRVGWGCFPGFAGTMAGRAVLFAFGETLEGALESSPRAYTISLPYATVTARRVGDRHWRIEMRDVHSFVESYQYGVLEGGILAFRYQPSIRIRRLTRRCDADFDVRWR